MTSAPIHPKAIVESGTTIGHFTVIEDDVHIGKDCRIGHHVVIKKGSRIGNGVQVGDHTIIGQQPMRAANSAVTVETTQTGAVIGNSVRIGSASILYAGCTLAEDVFVADLATIREEVQIGIKTIVGRGVAIENKCSIGSYCKLETNAYITAYSTIGDRVFVAPGVLTSNDNFIGRTEERFKHFKGAVLETGSRVGVGAILLPGIELASEAVLAAGAILTKNTEPSVIYKGVPAKAAGPVPAEQLLSSNQ
ncbi:MAG: DapH/DapD/GlmU-related protein [Bacteroidetes bacterium]|nr:DapH/DapD/GlmU-related protein [Bacteroidota bacterium]